MSDSVRVVEVFADVGCPFTHVGLRRFVERRNDLGRDDVILRVRAWPLEIVNGEPLDAVLIAEEIDEIREQVAGDLFIGFDQANFPRSTRPAMALAAAAHRVDPRVGEAVSLALRDRLFEQGGDIGSLESLATLAAEHGVTTDERDHEAVLADPLEGVRRGVIGSPHYFTPEGGFFCPSLEVSRDSGGHLQILVNPEEFDHFVDSCW